MTSASYGSSATVLHMDLNSGTRVAFTTASGYGMAGTLLGQEPDRRYLITGADGRTYRRTREQLLGNA